MGFILSALLVLFLSMKKATAKSLLIEPGSILGGYLRLSIYTSDFIIISHIYPLTNAQRSVMIIKRQV